MNPSQQTMDRVRQDLSELITRQDLNALDELATEIAEAKHPTNNHCFEQEYRSTALSLYAYEIRYQVTRKC